MKRTSLIASIILVGATATASAVPPTMSFTARITDTGGNPIEGNVDVVFRVFDAETTGTMIWEESQIGLVADAGLLYAALGSIDPVNNGLDEAVFDGNPRWLEIVVSGDILSPRLPLISVPYAIKAGSSDRLGSLSESEVQVRVGSSCPAGNAIRTINADGSVVCEPDDDTNSGGDITGVTAGSGLSGGGASGAVTLTVDTTAIQARVTGTCPAGSSIRSVDASGAVVCETDDDTNSGGDITGVTAGAGLSGGGASGAVTLTVDTSVIQARVGTCAAGSAIRAVAVDGTVTCETDDDTNSGGDITGVTAGTGLAGGGTTGTVTLTVDTATIQARVGSCAAGSSIRAVAVDGTPTCEPDDNSGGDITGVTAGSGLSGGGASGAVTLSVDTTVIQARVGTCAAGSSIRAVAVDGTVTCEPDDNSGGDITGVTASTGLLGGGASGAVSLSVDPTQVQDRVTGTCPAGSSIRVINQDGTVTCETDDSGGGAGDITSVNTPAGSGLTGGAATGDVTLGIATGGVTSTHIGNNQVTMAKTSAPIGVQFSLSATWGGGYVETLIYPSATGFVPDSNGSCFATAKIHSQTVVGTGWAALRVAVEENGVNLVTDIMTDGLYPDGNQPIASFAQQIQVGAASSIVLWQADATTVVTVAAGRQYRFGCAVENSNTNTFASHPVNCQIQFVCN